MKRAICLMLIGMFSFSIPLVTNATRADQVLLVGMVTKFDQNFLFMKSGDRLFKIPMKYVLYPKLKTNEELKIAATDKLIKEWAVTKNPK